MLFFKYGHEHHFTDRSYHHAEHLPKVHVRRYLAQHRVLHFLGEIAMPKYAFQAYDVLQCNRNGEWLDFSTIRTAAEGVRAAELVDTAQWDGAPLSFRIRRGFNAVVYTKQEPQMSVKALKAELAKIGYTVRKTEYGELRVNVKNGTEATAYYATDAADALGTARAMYASSRGGAK